MQAGRLILVWKGLAGEKASRGERFKTTRIVHISNIHPSAGAGPQHWKAHFTD